MNNALSIVGNGFQGDARRVLCCCSAGLLRSPTAANVLHREFALNTRSAGLVDDYALIPVTTPLLWWADEIVVMTDQHYLLLLQKLKDAGLDDTEFPKPGVTVLGIPDNFAYMEDSLQDLIIKQYKLCSKALLKQSGS